VASQHKLPQSSC